MKNLLFLFLFLPTLVMGQDIEDSASLSRYHRNDSILRMWPRRNVGFWSLQPAHMITISGKDKQLNMDFKGDSLIVSGNMPLTEGAKRFIDWCRIYMRTKIDSLETELKKCHGKIYDSGERVGIYNGRHSPDLHIEGTNYIPKMGNSSIYDKTTWIDYDTWKKQQKEPVFLTFQMLLDYEKECSNDSTKVRTHKRNTGICLSDGGDCLLPEHYENIWIHREPTFKGFVEWMRNRK